MTICFTDIKMLYFLYTFSLFFTFSQKCSDRIPLTVLGLNKTQVQKEQGLHSLSFYYLAIVCVSVKQYLSDAYTVENLI